MTYGMKKIWRDMDEHIKRFLESLEAPEGIDDPSLQGPPKGERVRSEGEFGERVFYTMLGNNVEDPNWANPEELPEDVTDRERIGNAERAIQGLIATLPILSHNLEVVIRKNEELTKHVVTCLNWIQLHQNQHGFGYGPPRY